MEIAGRKIGPEHPPYWVADIGANHDGDLSRAHHLIELAASAGADAVKFQNFNAPKIASRRGFEELGQIGHQASWGKSVYETYEDASIPLEWASSLQAKCAALGTTFLTTPYDLETVDAIDPYVPAWKIGSGDITYLELIRKVALKGKPVFLATGASNQQDIRRALEELDDEPGSGNLLVPVVLLQCNSDYSGDGLRYTNLRTLDLWHYPALRSKGALPRAVGLSDHTPGHIAVCAAVARGASVIEKHFTDDKTRSGPDHAFAMEPQEWREMVEAANLTWQALGDGVKRVEENEREAVIVQRRALRYVASMPNGGLATRGFIPAGFVLHKNQVIATRPCPSGALEPYRIDEVIGRRLKRDVEMDTLVRLEDFE